MPIAFIYLWKLLICCSWYTLYTERSSLGVRVAGCMYASVAGYVGEVPVLGGRAMMGTQVARLSGFGGCSSGNWLRVQCYVFCLYGSLSNAPWSH
ncbi:hypothetical protein F5Y16DRAFT_362004 [Xylariaceae sp. FL0255]|nr:hypothetical protein F5Y16DRAFT_362004 [Xylariaceae sp. FL0255]